MVVPIVESLSCLPKTLEIETLANQEYKWGFESDIDSDAAPLGLSEETVRYISAKKEEPQWMLDWRLKGISVLADDGRAT